MKNTKEIEHRFNEPDREAVYRAIKLRRDMRHFKTDPVPPEILERLLLAFHQAPNVGLMQPWRIIRITENDIRNKISVIVEEERKKTAKALNERQKEFLQLKVEGILDCGELLIVALADDREKHIFGRRTLPDMDLASVACAIQNMWLAARAEGLGLGWVSLFDPDVLSELLEIPEGGEPVAILCLGHVEAFYSAPMLEEKNWVKGMPLEKIMFENKWQKT